MYFHVDMNFITSGFKQISTAAQFQKELVQLDLPVMLQDGYVMAYVSNESDELNYVHFDDFAVTHSKTPIVQVDDYYPFGLTFNSFTRSYSEPQKYKYNGKEEQEEWGVIDYGARMYMADIGRWGVVDPLAEYMRRHSPYNFSFDNPINFIDFDGMIPWPVREKFNNFSRRVASWFGPRNVKDDPYASKNHKGLDINFGSKFDDYGAPVLSTHDGVVHDVKESTSGDEGRQIVIRAKDGTFQTVYMHLKSIKVKVGDEVKEGQEIGEIGASARGSEKGTASHLHYEIHKKNSEGVMVPYNPTEGNGDSEENIVDPQKWIKKPQGVLETYSAPEWAKESIIGAHIYFFFTGNDSGLSDQTNNDRNGRRLDMNGRKPMFWMGDEKSE